MKRVLKSLCFTLLAAVISVTSLVSCGESRNVIYYEDGNGKIIAAMNENMFSYHLSENKTVYLYSFGSTTDAAEFWNIQASEDGRTIGDYAFDTIVNNAREMVASAYVYEDTKNNVEEMKDALAENDIQIEKQVDELMNQLISTQGSKSGLESFLSGYGIDIKNLRSYYELYYKMTTLQNAITVSEDEKKDYFRDNYSIVKHILVNTSFKVKDDGSRVSLTEAELAEKKALAESINARLSAGESFEELWEIYKDSDAAGAQMYPEGYFVRKNSNFTVEFEEAALDMKEGEIRTIESSYGIHIIKKYPMDAEKYNLYTDVYSDLDKSVAGIIFDELIKPYMDNVKIDMDVLADYNIVSAPILQ